MQHLFDIVKGILAGLLISVGGTVYLSCESPVVGSIFFTIGLFVICEFGFNLFTGKCGYLTENKPSYLLFLLEVWVGNLIGCLSGGLAVGLARPELAETAARLSEKKLAIPLHNALILAVFCGLLMYIAVHTYKTASHPLGKYLALFLCVPVFILSGFEHSIADMFYLACGRAFLPEALLFLAVVTVGNVLGGILLPLASRLTKRENVK